MQHIRETREASTVSESTASVRRADLPDIEEIVSVHLEAFPDFFLAQLGPRFLARYYASILSYDTGIVLVGVRDRKIVGFVAGALNPSGFYRAMRRRKWQFAWPIFAGALRRPRLSARIIANVLRVRGEAERADASVSCELASIAVLAESRRSGIGRQLVSAFLERAWRLEAVKVYLTTDAQSNDAANRFYQCMGFRRSRTFEAFGDRPMHEYAISRPHLHQSQSRDREGAVN
jgi:ribosomal protein S18 acetylase RimI-like enzyme